MWWQSFFDETYLELWAHLHSPTQCEAEAAQLMTLLDLQPGDRVLDAPCGYGRISLPLARRGVHVVGVDYSPALLNHARESESSEELATPIQWVRADLRTNALPTGCKAALNLFSSLGYGSEADDVATLQNLHSALAPGGTLFIETMHRDAIVYRLAKGETAGFRGPAGVVLRERNAFDPISGTLNSTWTWTSPTIAGSRQSTIRIYSIPEIVALVHRAGFTNARCFAGLSGAPLTEANLEERLGLLCTAQSGSAPQI